ncbi:ATP-binding protein [Leptospira gomenensis]|uniref:ATP-binding protein n=1 Tax=Leptospira gomenensis TaxID=2484974 RepID=A0A5F1YDI1_9LEPT|nr:YifB family Mg chelatase-like AAA ATPase [Leptospira gomenensis]TGK35026.1 ATP-binding protein [Leptospira gomenensis]TGK35296.1 ATP-binding protein [Leptospira gomenensis]TGK51781.1 ATP-binding protein [Leptospira gomenensis]TGK58376.1 ATP-binding protein [Leptospira gomenensis]
MANSWICLTGANLEGLEAFPVSVEINLKRGIPRFMITGLAAQSIRESAERVRVALDNSGYHCPFQNILVNLAPAGRKKEGTLLDLPIACGVLAVTDQIFSSGKLDRTVLLGELGLDGSLKPLRGVLPILSGISSEKYDTVILPRQNEEEASLLKKFEVFGISHLRELEEILENKKAPVHKSRIRILDRETEMETESKFELYQDQMLAFRALQICVSGWHHLLLTGPPGTGKSLLARIAGNLLPPPQESEALDILKIRSAQSPLKELVVERPYRSPHHTTSDISLVGGSRELRMGEVTLAHRGILFLDEISEYKSGVLQTLREPMEEGHITVSRISGSITYPAQFLLIAAANPCPCGYFGVKEGQCKCGEQKIKKYQAPYAGPFRDRIDLEVQMHPSLKKERKKTLVSLEEYKLKAKRAAEIQWERYKDREYLFNGQMRGETVNRLLRFDRSCEDVLEHVMRSERFSVRKLNQIRKVARTIADLEEKESVEAKHLLEALNFQNAGNNGENRAIA